MKQVFIKKGQAVVEEVPAPQCEEDTILVKVHHSCISAGTEMSGVKSSGTPLWRRALREPEKVKKVLQSAAVRGIAKTKSLVEGKLEAGMVVGYSAAGIVVGVGTKISDIHVGDYVACAGAQCAHHAEYISVPRNLSVRIPENVSTVEASMVTLGAIAMQGVRRANTTLGETFVVIGLGVIGQLSVQLLKASGCRVIVSDLDDERIRFALQHGADAAVRPDDENDAECIRRLTGGIGADGVLITAATKSDDVVSTAFQMCRRKGRVVLVGDVGLHLKRGDFYSKEIDFFISTSYGPGRYDTLYEEKGLEYPVAYVRWTENRNMQEVLRLIREKKLHVEDMIQAIFPLEQAFEAYESLKNAEKKPLMALLSYAAEVSECSEKTRFFRTESSKNAKICVALAGAGSFAKSMHLPNIEDLSALYHLTAIASRSGHNAAAIAKQFHADYATTNYEALLKDDAIALIFITTRHSLHATMVLQALKAGKHVFVEKPLALCQEELNQIKRFYEEAEEKPPMLLTGFNRRFSKHMQAIREITDKRTHPLLINYTMNAGYIPMDAWVHGEEGGGRNIGEACHIYDLFNCLTNAKVQTITAQAIHSSDAYYSSKDNFVATITYQDGSVANLIYTAMGAKAYPKETMEVFFDGKVLVLDDYKRLIGFGVKVDAMESKISQKGQREEIELLAKTLLDGGEWSIPLWQQLQAMEIAFAVERQI